LLGEQQLLAVNVCFFPESIHFHKRSSARTNCIRPIILSLALIFYFTFIVLGLTRLKKKKNPEVISLKSKQLLRQCTAGMFVQWSLQDKKKEKTLKKLPFKIFLFAHPTLL
jgi:hypothetical protein